jgi:hypothetical protein
MCCLSEPARTVDASAAFVWLRCGVGQEQPRPRLGRKEVMTAWVFTLCTVHRLCGLTNLTGRARLGSHALLKTRASVHPEVEADLTAAGNASLGQGRRSMV